MLGKSRRHLKRYREITSTLSKHGRGWMIERLGLGHYVGKYPREDPGDYAPVHLREMLEELGPTFVKLGQLLSTRPDIVPENYIAELSKLQDTAPTLPASVIRGVIESEFSIPVEDLFSDFDDKPLAAASLGQVHRAILKDGAPVIIKVQRPGIRDQVETDIEILYKRAKFLESHWERARTYGVTDIVDEFAITIREELDYTREGRNTDRLRETISPEHSVRLPQVLWEYTTSKVLTLEEMRGIKITDVPQANMPGVDAGKVAVNLARAFLEQVFVNGFFHADPHPGNILVDNAGNISLVDCGMVGKLDAENRAGAVRMLMAFEQQDTRVLADEIIDLGIVLDDVDFRRFTIDLGKVLRGYYDLPSKAINMGELLMRVLNVSAAHKIRLPTSFAVIGKVFAGIEGICGKLDRDFNFTGIARDYVGRAVRSELRSDGAVTEFYRAVVGLRHFLLSLPEQMERLMRKAVEGNLRLEFKHQGLENMSDDFKSSANRISIALIVGSTIIGSSLIVTAGAGPGSLFGLPILGLIGYLVATVFGIWLVVSILLSRKHR